jgi:hypothetical protein
MAMDILYIKSPRASSGLQETRGTLRERCRHIPDVALRDMTLAGFAQWYIENAQKQPPERFDLQIVECSLDSLHDQIWAYRNACSPDKDWDQIVAKSAMGALTWARIGCELVIFVHDGGEVTESLREDLRRFPWVTLATREQVADVDFLHDAAFRVDIGLKAVKSPQQPGLSLDGGRQLQAFDVPPHIARFVVQTFENDDIHRWLFDLCGSLFGKRYEAARTLCVISRYARRVVTESLEGMPLQFQCVIVPTTWWDERAVELSLLVTFKEPQPRASMARVAELNSLIHFSDGYSSLFILTEDGTFKALVLVEVGTTGQSTRHRLDGLLRQFSGIVVSTDRYAQVWVHGPDRPMPLICAHDIWQVDPSAEAVNTLGEALRNIHWPPIGINHMLRLVRHLSDERIGGFLIFHPDPQRLATEANGIQLRGEVIRHIDLPIAVNDVPLATPARVLSLDGAHLFDHQGRLRLLCQHLAPTIALQGGVGGGTKHATAHKVAKQFREAIVVAISHDGPVTVYASGKMTSPRGVEPY